MWIALISAVLGAAAVLTPPILHEVAAARAHARELERMRAEAELEREGKRKPRSRARKRAAAGDGPRPDGSTGFPAIDRLNALLAPAAACAVLGLFVVVGLFYSFAIVEKYRDGQLAEFADLSRAIWGSLIGDAVQAVLGYLFGYHLTRAAVERSAAPRRDE